MQNTISLSLKREVQTSASRLIGYPSTSSATTSWSKGDWFVNTFWQPIDQYIKICWLHLLLHGHEAWKISESVCAMFSCVNLFFWYTVTLNNTSEFSFYIKSRGLHESYFRSCNSSLTFIMTVLLFEDKKQIWRNWVLNVIKSLRFFSN